MSAPSTPARIPARHAASDRSRHSASNHRLRSAVVAHFFDERMSALKGRLSGGPRAALARLGLAGLEAVEIVNGALCVARGREHETLVALQRA